MAALGLSLSLSLSPSPSQMLAPPALCGCLLTVGICGGELGDVCWWKSEAYPFLSSSHQGGEREPMGHAEPGLKQTFYLYFLTHPQLHTWEFSVSFKKDS